MKRLILLIVFCFLLSGCTTEVNLKITEDTVSEKINIFNLKENVYNGDKLNEETSSSLEIFEREYEFYTMNTYENNGYVGKIYNYSCPIELWFEISHLRTCYDSLKLKKSNNSITLTTSKEYRCGYLYGANNVTLKIESDLNISSSNADKTEENTLIWNINEDNYKNKPIKIIYNLNKTEENKLTDNNINNKNDQTENVKNENYIQKYLTYILTSILLIVIFITIYIYLKIKNSNK